MTDREKNKDLKEFTELVKHEIATKGHYEREINVITRIEIDTTLAELDKAIHGVNFYAKGYNEQVISAAVALATKALILACNAQRDLDTWEAMRA